jgi:hypothetical protein
MTIVSLIVWLAWWVGNSFLGKNRGRLGRGIGIGRLVKPVLIPDPLA